MNTAIPAAAAGFALVAIVLWDAFEAIVLPRRVTRRFRLTRLFYRSTWLPWRAVANWMPSGKRRESFLGFFGPLSLLVLLGVWATGLVAGFALLQRGAGPLNKTWNGPTSFGTYLYLSGTSFFTLGLGDVTPTTPLARWLTVAEAGMGFGFLAIVIGYLPVIYQSFSRREAGIVLLDARAGSPPTAAELLRRHAQDHGMEALRELLYEWERWSAELLESHISYPVVSYFRSQHDNQSWLAALTAILDTSALTIVGVEGACARQARLTFAMARHAAVDLSQVFFATPRAPDSDRLPAGELERLRTMLANAGLQLRAGPNADQKLADLRLMYEPYIHSLSRHLCMNLPPWIAAKEAKDNWRTSAWSRISGFESRPSSEIFADDHS